MKLVRVLLLMLGLALLGVLVARNDPAEIFASIGRLSWRLGILVCFPFTLVTLFDTLGWRFAFLRDRVGFGTLLGARMAGEAFNLTTPTAALGGEAVKTWLLRGHAPFDESLLSVIVAKTTILLAQGVFLLIGIVLAWLFVLPDSLLLRGMLWLLTLEIVAVGAFVAAQNTGMLEWGQRFLQRIGVRPSGSGETLRRVDRGLASFYRREPRRLLLSIAFHLVAWLLGSVEAYLTLRFLGVDVSLTTATVIEAFGTGIRFATFMIPASVGALEGGYAVTFSALGLGSSTGVAFGLTRRVREIVWVGAGLIAFAVMRERPARTSEPKPLG
jgi:glycosyltransferase 2 family protein